jgi:hypothetical protein
MHRTAVPLLLVLLGVSCRDAGGGAQPGDGEPAGQVLELTGAVTAAREGKPARSLASGDSIFRDDTITTPADGAVTIRLSHNKARWSLGAGRARRVDRSPAWRAEVSSGSAFDDDDALPTSAAGRHSEPQAGDTRATAPTPKAEAAAADTRVAEAPPPAPARKRGRKASAAPAAPQDSSPAPEPSGPGGLALGAVPAAPSGGGGGEGRSPTLAVPGSRGVSLGKLSVRGARGKSELAEEMTELGSAVQQCAMTASSSGAVSLRFQIGRRGDVSGVKVRGPAALVGQVGACLRKKVSELEFPARREGTTRVRQSIRFQVR